MTQRQLRAVVDRAAEIYREQPAQGKNAQQAVREALEGQWIPQGDYREICRLLGHHAGAKAKAKAAKSCPEQLLLY